MYLHLLKSLKTLNFLYEKDLEIQPLLFSMPGGYMSQDHRCNLTCLHKDYTLYNLCVKENVFFFRSHQYGFLFCITS